MPLEPSKEALGGAGPIPTSTVGSKFKKKYVLPMGAESPERQESLHKPVKARKGKISRNTPCTLSTHPYPIKSRACAA